jgi:hypothetical protein
VAAAEEAATADAKAEAQHLHEERARHLLLTAAASKGAGSQYVLHKGANTTSATALSSSSSSTSPDRSVPEERESWFLTSLYAQGYRELLAKKREARVLEVQADRLIPLDLEEVSKKLNDPVFRPTRDRASLRHMAK